MKLNFCSADLCSGMETATTSVLERSWSQVSTIYQLTQKVTRDFVYLLRMAYGLLLNRLLHYTSLVSSLSTSRRQPAPTYQVEFSPCPLRSQKIYVFLRRKRRSLGFLFTLGFRLHTMENFGKQKKFSILGLGKINVSIFLELPCRKLRIGILFELTRSIPNNPDYWFGMNSYPKLSPG